MIFTSESDSFSYESYNESSSLDRLTELSFLFIWSDSNSKGVSSISGKNYKL